MAPPSQPAGYVCQSKRLFYVAAVRLDCERVSFLVWPSNNTYQTIARHPHWVVSYAWSDIIRNCNRHPSGFIVPSVCSCSSSHPTWPLEASVSSVEWSSGGGNGSIRAKNSRFWSFFISAAFSAVRAPKCFSRSFYAFWFRYTATPAKFGPKRQKTLRRTRNERISYMFVGGCNHLNVYVVGDEISNILGRITLPR